MTAQLNHTIVYARDAQASAEFLSEILGLPRPRRFGQFWVVETGNGVSLDFLGTEQAIAAQHYAFLISEQEFDAVLARIRERALPYWADPAATRAGDINRNDGGRGMYFEDPSGHYLEVLTRPYGSG